ncbi:MAG: hypothetical protein HC770_11525 [Pseudanabaena sp. CRU_2_10]|nr:hypothetical protein [Pseudanabaena sp. CRU_2_10]
MVKLKLTFLALKGCQIGHFVVQLLKTSLQGEGYLLETLQLSQHASAIGAVNPQDLTG